MDNNSYSNNESTLLFDCKPKNDYAINNTLTNGSQSRKGDESHSNNIAQPPFL